MGELVVIGEAENPWILFVIGHISEAEAAKIISENGYVVGPKMKFYQEFWIKNVDEEWEKSSKHVLGSTAVTTARW